jgi:nucleoid-associated protein YgaU
VTTGVVTRDFNIMELGEVRFPKGNKLDVVTWDAKLPGSARQGMSYVKEWQDPNNLYNILQAWKNTGVILRLLITSTPINLDVFIDELNPDFEGGMGDINYSITLTQWRELKAFSVSELASSTQSTTTAETSRLEPPVPKTYTVVTGDSLWKIAQKIFKKGARYPEINELNKATIGDDPNLIKPGQVLTMPAA